MGADIVAIGTPDRWEGAPVQMDPRFIMPEAKSIIAMGFRVMRGSLRGIEEGTFFSNYSSMGYGGLNYLYIPLTMINLAKFIEDFGYEAIPLGHLSPWRAIDNDGTPRVKQSRAVEPGKPIPDVMVHLRIAAFLCGLGEIGWSKMLLTPQFGPRQRIGVLMTEAELDPDPIIEPGTICDKCMMCVSECPTQALPTDKSVKVNLAGHDVEWSDIDLEKCSIGFRGGEFVEEGETGEYMPGRDDIKPGPGAPFYRKPANVYIHGEAIGGSKGCMRACMMHLEEQGKIGNKFKTPFRRKKLWSVDWAAS
jgi:ferredoxin